MQRGHLTPVQADARDEADRQLIALGIRYRRVPDESDDRGCTVKDGVEIQQIGDVKLTRPALVTQDMAIRMGRWVHEVLKPRTRKIFKSQLASIDVFGSYSCRNVYGKAFGGRFSGRLSEHAHANAIDIGGFKLADGREIAYLKNWRTPGAPSEFLKGTSAAACEIFNITLTPDYDRFHHNHIHVDASPKKEDTAKLCGMKGRFDAKAVPGFARYKAPGKRWTKKSTRKKALKRKVSRTAKRRR